MDRWLFLVGVVVVCCILCPPFLGLWMGIACFYAVASVVYGILKALMP